jgi:hypothetical protein
VGAQNCQNRATKTGGPEDQRGLMRGFSHSIHADKTGGNRSSRAGAFDCCCYSQKLSGTRSPSSTTGRLKTLAIFPEARGPYLKCLASGKDRPAKPEEIVRQLYLKKLMEEDG